MEYLYGDVREREAQWDGLPWLEADGQRPEKNTTTLLEARMFLKEGDRLGLRLGQAVQVLAVKEGAVKNFNAACSSIEPGDVVCSVNGQPVNHATEMIQLLLSNANNVALFERGTAAATPQASQTSWVPAAAPPQDSKISCISAAAAPQASQTSWVPAAAAPPLPLGCPGGFLEMLRLCRSRPRCPKPNWREAVAPEAPCLLYVAGSPKWLRTSFARGSRCAPRGPGTPTKPFRRP